MCLTNLKHTGTCIYSITDTLEKGCHYHSRIARHFSFYLGNIFSCALLKSFHARKEVTTLYKSDRHQTEDVYMAVMSLGSHARRGKSNKCLLQAKPQYLGEVILHFTQRTSEATYHFILFKLLKFVIVYSPGTYNYPSMSFVMGHRSTAHCERGHIDLTHN